MKFFEKLKGKYDLARWALKRAREAEAQVDELLQLCEEKDERIKQLERLFFENRDMARFWETQNEIKMALLKTAKEKEDQLNEAYARLKVDADVMRIEITQYREIIRNTAEDAMKRGVWAHDDLARKEQDNAGNDRGE